MADLKRDRVVVAGSERVPVAAAHPTTEVDPAATITVTVLIRRRPGSAVPDVDAGTDLPSKAHLSREEFATNYGADASDVSLVEAFAKQYGLQVGQVNLAARTVSLTGTIAAFGEAFEVKLRHYEHPGGTYRGREGKLSVPRQVADVIEGVFGLDDRPQVQPKIRWQPQAGGAAVLEAANSLTVLEIAQLYGFPTDITGQGQCIAIVEFGGGYQQQDLQHFFQNLKIAEPTVSAISVDGAQNAPGDPADGEVALDIEVAGAVAPGARLAVYFAPNSDQGFIDAITSAVHDTTNRPSVLSISWGGPEETWTGQTRNAIDQAFTDAGLLGMTVLVAAGDHGSADRPSTDAGYDGLAHVDFPASSPHATGCGGTHLEGNGGAITLETVWNDGDGWATGGGVSDLFDKPTWQRSANVPPGVNPPGTRVGRGVPDVAGNADITTGYEIYLNGSDSTAGGTSAVAPLWAGLVALLNQATGRQLGFINPVLYSPQGTRALRKIISGSNAIGAMANQPATAGYSAAKGWNACTGLGAPDGKALRTLFGTKPSP